MKYQALYGFLTKQPNLKMSTAKMFTVKAPITTKVVECSGSVER